jgi:addiction module HigA family antidote
MSARHVGEKLAELLEERGEEQVLWAKRVGCSAKHLSQIVTGKVGLSADIAVRMEAFLGVDALPLMYLQAAYDVDVARLRLAAKRAT